MKKILSLLLSVAMLIGTIACVDISALADMPEFEINQYIANYLADNYNGETVVSGDKSVKRNYLEYYSLPSNASPAQILLTEMNNNATFMTSVAAWEALTFEPSNIADDMLDEKGYYETIIFNILNCELNSTSFSNENLSSVSMLSVNITKGVTEILKDCYQIDYDAICSTPWSELTAEVQLALSEQVGEQLYKWDTRNSQIKDLSGIIDTAKTVKEYVETAAKYGQLSKCSEDIKAVLYDMYSNCSVLDTTMKAALYEAYTVCGDSFNAFQVDLVNGVLKIGSKTIGSMIDTMWKAAVACP